MGSLRNWFNQVLAPTSRFKFVRSFDGRDFGGQALRYAERRMDARVATERAATAAEMSTQLGEGPITKGHLQGVWDGPEYRIDLGGGETAPIESFGDEVVKLRGLPNRTLLASYSDAMSRYRASGEAVSENAYIKAYQQELQRRGLPIPIHDELHQLHEGPGGALNPDEVPTTLESAAARLTSDELREALNNIAAEPNRNWDPKLKSTLELELRSRLPGKPDSPEGALGRLPQMTFLPTGLYGSDIQTLPTNKLRTLHGLYAKTRPEIAERIAAELRKRSEGGLGPLPGGLMAGAAGAATSYWGGIKKGLGIDDESIGSAVRDAAQQPGGYSNMGAINSWVAQQLEPLANPNPTADAINSMVRGFAKDPMGNLRAMGSAIKRNPAGAAGIATTMWAPMGGKRHKITLR